MTDFDSIDFFSDRSVVENPYPYFEYLREKCPAFREPHHGVVAVTGYDDVLAVSATCRWRSWLPSRHRPIKTQQGVVVGQAALFDLDMGGRSDDVEPPAAQQFGRLDMLGITDRLVFGPDSGVVGDLVALTPDLDPLQVGGDLDAPTDRDRVRQGWWCSASE